MNHEHEVPSVRGRLSPRFTRRATITAQFETVDEALEFVRWALANEAIGEPTISVTPIATSTAQGRHVKYDAAVKGQVGPVSDGLPYVPVVS